MADSIVSVALAVADGQTLKKIDRSLPLDEIVAKICEAHDVPEESYKYALQVARPSPKADNPLLANRYVTPELLPQVLDGTELRLVFSATTTAQILLESLKEGPGPGRKSAYRKLASACEDPEFARCFVEVDGPSLITTLLSATEADELAAALACLRLSMQHGFLKELSLVVLDRVVGEIAGPGGNAALREALLIGCLILAGNIEEHAEHLRLALTTLETLTLIKVRSSKVQLAVLGMVNALLLSSDADCRRKDLKSLSSQKSRQLIFRHVLGSGQVKVDHDLAHQLHVLQTLLLNYMLGGSQHTLSVDLEELRPPSLSWKSSTETLLDETSSMPTSPFLNRSSSRITLDGRDLDYMPSIPSPSARLQPSLRRDVSRTSPPGNAPVSRLALDCLEYFSNHYRDNFVLAKEEAELTSGISQVGQDVVEILCSVFHIGKRHGQTSGRFSPIFFAGREPFFYEVFCHVIWTLGRARRDLKAREPEDHLVALRVVHRQLEEALEARPSTFSALGDILKDMTASKVQDIWITEQQEKFENILQKHPAVIELRNRIKPNAEKLVKLQRVNALKIGHKFPKQLETLKAQKAKNWWFAHVSEDERVVIHGEWNPEVQSYTSLQKRISIASATGLATGKRCPHAKGRKYLDESLIFSLLHEEGSLDFIAPNKDIFNLWTDGLNILLDRPVESTSFKEDVEIVIDMEVRLKLLELGDENISVPFEAPPVPPLPENYDFHDESEA